MSLMVCLVCLMVPEGVPDGVPGGVPGVHDGAPSLPDGAACCGWLCA